MSIIKEAAETTTLPTCSKSPINDSPVDIPERFRFTNHLQQHDLFLQTELKNKDNYIKSVLLQLSKQSDRINCFQNQTLKLNDYDQADGTLHRHKTNTQQELCPQ